MQMKQVAMQIASKQIQSRRATRPARVVAHARVKQEATGLAD